MGFPGVGIPMLKKRWLKGCLIFGMGIPILARGYLYIEMAPCVMSWNVQTYGLIWFYQSKLYQKDFTRLHFNYELICSKKAQTWIFICIIFYCNNLCQILKINIKMFIHNLNLYVLVSRDLVKFHHREAPSYDLITCGWFLQTYGITMGQRIYNLFQIQKVYTRFHISTKNKNFSNKTYQVRIQHLKHWISQC